MSRFNIELPALEMCKHCEGRGFVLDCKDLCAGADFEDEVHSKNCYRMCGECCSTGIADNFDDDDEDDELEDERLIDEMYAIAGIPRRQTSNCSRTCTASQASHAVH